MKKTAISIQACEPVKLQCDRKTLVILSGEERYAVKLAERTIAQLVGRIASFQGVKATLSSELAHRPATDLPRINGVEVNPGVSFAWELETDPPADAPRKQVIQLIDPDDMDWLTRVPVEVRL